MRVAKITNMGGSGKRTIQAMTDVASDRHTTKLKKMAAAYIEASVGQEAIMLALGHQNAFDLSHRDGRRRRRRINRTKTGKERNTGGACGG
jgi:hypothetical protein